MSALYGVVIVYNVAAILQLHFTLYVILFPMLNVLHFYIITFRSMCAVLNMADFCSPLIFCFPDTLLRYCLNDFKIVPVVTGIIFVSTLHIRWTSIVRSLTLESSQFLS